jgi:hypothetical protein
MTEGTSPASSGPAGAHFEGQVGASFLLSLLVAAEPRGLPGTTIDRVEFQRAAEGHPLDDIVVHAHDAQGNPAVLEVQVKKSITFAPGDPTFRDVVGQIAEASHKPEFLSSRYELGIAISRTSHKIDGSYQTVLTWARQLDDAATFIDRLNRPGSAHKDMRTFVGTFRSHLRDAGAAHDDETVWRLLRKLQILVFDLTAFGSASEELAKERAARALHPGDTRRAAELWAVLTELSIGIASAGGDRTRDNLMADLQQKSFRLAADRHNLSALAALSEASRNTLADIGDRVGGALLTRHERVASVHAALDSGRYVEIRGDAGVGKSGVLKHFAEQISAEARVVVLSPSRTVPGGWLALRTTLGFDGTARDFLSDLAAAGSAILFLDNLDFYEDRERLTVIDLIREAAKIPGMSVIATARRDFGVAEASWLPKEIIDQLGRTESVVIDELTDAETEELRHAAPQLRALLADNHPARQVARNLFRLSRLANRPSDAPMPRTEVDMAEQWWETADGKKDQSYRDRARVLNALAKQALSGTEQLDVSGFPSTAVDALVASETLRDRGPDRATFRHDVLREWAIANLLFSDPLLIERLPLGRPGPASLARGVELAARMSIVRATDSVPWRSLVGAVSKEGHHGSWRRAALLALVRSEIGTELLNRASAYLLDNQAEGLRELIRLVMAIDVESGMKLSALGVDPKLIPANLNLPNGPSWSRLILWLLGLGESLPAAALPEVVDLYTAWSLGTLGQDPFTPLLVQWLYRWLAEIETAREGVGVQGRRQPFQGEIKYEQIGTLEDDLRTGFLAFCNRTPTLAAEYLQSLRKHRHNERATREILKFRGALAQAAPKELAELTAELLLQKDDEDDDGRYDPLREAFGHHDLDFIPASPAQGPFMELLVHSREHGLELVRKVVDHAISFKSGGRDFGANAIKIPSVDGSERTFPWFQSYNWSRDLGSGPTIVASALMALEAWAHGRIEAGESFDSVLADVLGPPNSPAAYLLVAVDLLLSHWPTSRVAAIPFLASPELLCLDRHRMPHDNFELLDIFGLKALQKEPLGLANLASLKGRPSRRLMLDQLLPYYALDESHEDRDTLTGLLRHAASRLGPPKEQSNLGDPEFMAVHALNLIDPKNWHKKTVETEDGPRDGWEYVPPATESQHLQSLQDDAWRERQADAAMEARIRVALNDAGRSSPAFAAAAVDWAQSAAPVLDDSDDDDKRWMRQETVVTAATVAARDGGRELIATHGTWMRETFNRAFKGKNDPVHRMRSGLQFNPTAIAFVGMVLLLRNRFAIEDVRTILEAAGSDNPAAAHGFAATAGLLAQIDERLPRAALRCAFVARVQPSQQWRQPEAEFAAHSERCRQKVGVAIDAELAWLTGKQNEPEWPPFPPSPAHPRHRFVSRRGQRREPVEQSREPDVYTDHQAAALWLANTASLFDVTKRPWLRDIVKTYTQWTTTANGSELDDDEDVDRPPREWNDAFFKLLAYCLPGLTLSGVDQIALAPVIGLPDEAFLDVTTAFLRNVDIVYFNDGTLPEAQAAHVRSALARKVMTTRVWERHVRDRSKSIETHLGPAIAVVLFNDYGHFQPAKCYLYPKAIDRVEPFLPALREVAESGPFLLVAMALLNLLEVAPRATHLPLIVAAGERWLNAYADDKEFWVDHSIGHRLCSLFESILALDPQLFRPDQALRKYIDGLLASLVRLGIAEAHRLEESFRLLKL